MKNKKLHDFLLFLNGAVLFFVLVSFIATCTMMLFLSTMVAVTGIELTAENIGSAAKITFLNVVIISLLCTVFDAVRREMTVSRPLKKIREATERIVKGDFDVRIESIPLCDSGFNEIIDCINKIASELGGVESLRSDFISNVSHEFKNPLAVIKNYAILLEKGDIPKEKKSEYLKKISLSCDRLSDLVVNMLKLSKLENGQSRSKNEVYDLGEELCACFLSFESLWEEKGLVIETDIEDGVIVKNDREMLSLVWNNLLSNAIKFTENGGKVSLEMKSEGDFAVVSVSDTGLGMSNETGKHIFDKFYQGDTSHSEKGNGLGLALVKKVIDLTGSEISVESAPGKGSVFTVRLKREMENESEKAF